MSLPSLGRPPKNITKEMKQQSQKDESIRNEIEGKFGQGKRRFGLNQIMSKLSETAETEIAIACLLIFQNCVFFHLLIQQALNSVKCDRTPIPKLIALNPQNTDCTSKTSFSKPIAFPNPNPKNRSPSPKPPQPYHHCYNGLVSVIMKNVMETKSIKKKARNLIDKLSEISIWDDLMYEIYVRQAIELGLNDSEAGKVVSVEEVRAKFGLQK